MARPRGGARCPLEPRARTGRRRLGTRGRLARLVRGGRSGDRGDPRALLVEVRPEGRDGPADVLHPQVSERSDQRDSGLHGQPHLRGVLEASPRRVAQVQATLGRARVTHVTLLTLSPIIGSYLRTSTGTKYATSYCPLRSAGTQRTGGALGPGLERGEARPQGSPRRPPGGTAGLEERRYHRGTARGARPAAGSPRPAPRRARCTPGSQGAAAGPQGSAPGQARETRQHQVGRPSTARRTDAQR